METTIWFYCLFLLVEERSKTSVYLIQKINLISKENIVLCVFRSVQHMSLLENF